MAAIPAILSGVAAFEDTVPIARPFTPPLEKVVARLQPSYERGQLTNGPLVREFETAVSDRLGVEGVVAVSSCTAGLMLVLRAIGGAGPVMMPSFTFSASAHAVAWTGADPAFCECDPTTFQVDTPDAAARADATGASAVLATHVFGAPAPTEALEAVGRALAIPVVFDAAHALGAVRGGKPVGGFGAAEVFSLSPTKPVVSGEGGLVVTHDPALAAEVEVGRDYGNPGTYDTRFVGLNGRMSEFHAAIGLESLLLLDEHLDLRTDLASRYRTTLAEIPGIAVQPVADGDRSTYKDFTIAVDPEEFGLPRDSLVTALRAEGIDTRCYFSPPVHRHEAYAHLKQVDLPVTDDLAARVVSLPMFGALRADVVDRICEVIGAIHAHAEEVRARAA